MAENDSVCIGHEPCPECGSKDNLARYSDGHGYCFGCGHYAHGDGTPSTPNRRTRMSGDLIDNGEFRALSKRGITEETCRKFGYQVGSFAGGSVHIAPFTDLEGNIVGQQLRTPGKDFIVRGEIGDCLWGQHLWPRGGRMVVVTEGQLDAMSVSQVQGNKWPVVSVPNGVKSAKRAIAAQLGWLSAFETVVLMFDQDDPGRAAVAECAPMFPPGKCKVATTALKDANELLVADRGSEIIDAIWKAREFRPDGIVKLADIRDEVLTAPSMGLAWWSERLNALTYGRRLGEVYTFGAGTGIGKTDFLTQQVQYDVDVLGEKVGLFFLEQKPAETAKRVAGKFAGKCFHVPDGSWTQDELVEVIDRLGADDRLFLYDSFGAADWDVIAANIRHLAHHDGVRLFYVDHLTALADPEKERESLEIAMKAVATLAQELNVIIHLISHLATPDGTPHEEGGRVMIRHFKGSRSIGFWSFFMFGLERNQHHEDERWRSITTFRVLKDRYTGRSAGEVVYLGYDRETGKLFETEPPEDQPEGGFKDETTPRDY
jgi:twinkle protein